MTSVEESEPEAKRQRGGSPELELHDMSDEEYYDLDMDNEYPTSGLLGEAPASVSESDSSEYQLNMNSFAYHILSLEDIYSKIQTMVRDVHEIIQKVPASTLRTLLNHVNWDKDALLCRYFEDEEKFLAEARVRKDQDGDSEMEDGLCNICVEDVSGLATYSIACGHCHCVPCWVQYLTHTIMQEGMGQTITCPSCPIVVEDADVVKLVEDPVVLSKYKMLICYNFVESNKLMRWCPKAGCNNAVGVDMTTAAGRVDCSCGHSFCYQCMEDWHEPIKCELLKTWLAKLALDTGNSLWMTKNTKDCPTCGTMIEKNGGCNRMRCRKCNADFCWNCGKLWSSHTEDGYSCNRYISPESVEGTVRFTIARFAHFLQRYNNHIHSLRLETSLVSRLDEVASKYQASLEMTWNEVQFLKQAFHVLVKCRKTLRYTYAFAFYLENTLMAEIFNSNQSDLERETEALSEYLERDILSTKFTPTQNRTRICDKYIYCEQRRLVLIQHVYDGYKDGSWKFTN